jgi:HAD superfamily hydrolase (TIGR01509 family)
MKKINAIAFDLGGVLIKEKDYPLSPEEEILEKSFGNINNNEEYLDWAGKKTNFSKDKIKKVTEKIVENLYELREPEIFNQLPKMKLAIASNHLSAIHKWIEKANIKSKFDCILISADINTEKPKKEFFQKLTTKLNEKKENILFIDDSPKNIQEAKKFGLSVLLYTSSKSLTREINNYLK